MSVAISERRNLSAALDANPRQRRVLFMHAYLAGFTALQILYLALDDLKFNLALSLGYTCGYIFAYSVGMRWRSATTYAVSALSALAAAYHIQLWSQDMSLYGNVLGSLAGVLMVLLSFQAFSTNSHRFILMFSVVFLLFGAVASYDLKFMLLLPLFLVFSGCALYVSNQIDVHARASGANRLAMPQTGSLSRTFLGVLLRAIGGILLLSIVAYLMAPHSAANPRGLVLNKSATVEETDVTDQNPGEEQGQGESESGIGDDFDMTGGGEMSLNTNPVLKMKSHRAGYLRAKVYDIFSGSGWEQSAQLQASGSKPGALIELQLLQDLYATGASGLGYNVPLFDFPSETAFEDIPTSTGVRLADGNVFSTNNQNAVQYDIVQQQITLLADSPPHYVGAYQPFRLTNISRNSSGRLLHIPYVDRAANIRPIDLSRNLPKGFGYTMHSLEPRVSIRLLDEVYAAGPPAIVEPNTWLPLETGNWREEAIARGLDPASVRPVSQRLVNFARTKFGVPDIVDGKEVYPSIWDKAKRIHDWLARSGEFDYRLDHPKLPEGREVTEAFVFETQSGWCRYFASAMAVMCRINGVPARVVTGYAPGNYSLADNAYIYRGSNAHAWVEVYFDGYGWIMLDPTPESRSQFSDADSTHLFSAVIDFLQDLFVIDPAGTQRTIVEGLRLLWALLRDHWLLSLSGAVLLLLAAAGVSLGRRFLGRHRAVSGFRPEHELIGIYVQLLSRMRRLGFVLETGDTSQQVRRAVSDQFPELSEPVNAIVQGYEQAAFSRRAPSPDFVTLLRQALAEIDAFVDRELELRRQSKGAK